MIGGSVRTATAALLLALCACAALPAQAHQSLADGRATVTLHVNPDDEPIVGQAATVDVVKVSVRRNAHFAWRTCQCRLSITDPSGGVIDERPLTKKARIFLFTFPTEGAYQIAISGRYRQRRWRPFNVTFALRAVPASQPIEGAS